MAFRLCFFAFVFTGSSPQRRAANAPSISVSSDSETVATFRDSLRCEASHAWLMALVELVSKCRCAKHIRNRACGAFRQAGNWQ